MRTRTVDSSAFVGSREVPMAIIELFPDHHRS